jgi:hypothetical protein
MCELFAVPEPDEYKAAVLRRVADEADRNVLWTADHILNQPKQPLTSQG